jgi:hypothetical protein
MSDINAPEAAGVKQGQLQIKFDIRGLGTKQMAINTTALECKISAV